jgi:hypothetical protein
MTITLAIQMVYLPQWKDWKEGKWFLPMQQAGESVYAHPQSAVGSGTGPHIPPLLHRMLECCQLAPEDSDTDQLYWIWALEHHSKAPNYTSVINKENKEAWWKHRAVSILLTCVTQGLVKYELNMYSHEVNIFHKCATCKFAFCC